MKKVGQLFSELTNTQKQDIANQFSKKSTGVWLQFQSDLNFNKYRWIYSDQYGWLVYNAWLLPLKTNKF